MRRAWPWAVLVLAGLGTWHFALTLGIVSRAALAGPEEVLQSLPSVFSRGGNLDDVLSTLFKSGLAFLISVPCGVAVGFLVAFGGPMREPAGFVVDFLRSIPATALVPMFLIIYGTGDNSKVAVAVFSSGLVICLAAVSGFQSRNSTRLAVSQAMRLAGLRRVLLSDLPEALPQIFIGLRAGVSLSLILVVVSEMLIGSNRGLGRVIADMRNTDDKGRLYAAILVTGLIGYGYNWLLAKIEKTVVHWRGLA